MVESAYIHIPFCRQKCNYCSFVSFPILHRKGQYLSALKRQILREYKGENLKTLYFGGGTPSLLTLAELKLLLALFQFQPDAEVTLEINPETVNSQYFYALASTKVNRLSIGSRSFDNNILKSIGRKHKVEDVFQVIEEARSAGFSNISLDFIYGLPEQTLEGFIADLRLAVSLGVEHISLYGLKIEEGSFYYRKPPKNMADEELQAEMYLAAIDFLVKNGFEHYEISNFARGKRHSHHNINYWSNKEYYGFGLAAHGYVDGVRYANTENFEDYCTQSEYRIFEQNLSMQEILEEEIFLGLRLMQGINVKKINKKFGIDFERKYDKILKKYLQDGFITYKNGCYCFTNDGVLVSNVVLSEFLDG